jgi:hypothetical protein
VSAPTSAHEESRRRVLAAAYAFALSVARRESMPDKRTENADVGKASVETAGDRQ